MHPGSYAVSGGDLSPPYQCLAPPTMSCSSPCFLVTSLPGQEQRLRGDKDLSYLLLCPEPGVPEQHGCLDGPRGGACEQLLLRTNPSPATSQLCDASGVSASAPSRRRWQSGQGEVRSACGPGVRRERTLRPGPHGRAHRGLALRGRGTKAQQNPHFPHASFLSLARGGGPQLFRYLAISRPRKGFLEPPGAR